MTEQTINVGIDVPGGDPDDNGISHLERAIEALTRVSIEYEDQPVKFFAYTDKKNREKVEKHFAGRKNVTVVGDIEQEFPMDKKPEEMVKFDTTILRLANDLKQAVPQTERTPGHLDVTYSSGQSAAVVLYAFYSCESLGKIKSHHIRPSLATRMPYGLDKYFYINDVGAYKTTKPIDLFISAILTQILAETLYGDKSTPTIGMLDTPASGGAKRFFEQLKEYAGIVTPLDAFEGKSKIVAVDGFRGNIFLKAAEAVSRAMTHRVKHATLAQKLMEKDLLLLDKFCPTYRDGTADFKTEEYYNTIWAQVRELLAKKPEGQFLERLNELFVRVPGSQQYRMITGNNLDEILGKMNAVLEKNEFDFRQHIGDKLDFMTYAFFRAIQGAYNSIVSGKRTQNHRKPNIAILSNGEEDVKGDNFAQGLIRAIDENIGFVEPEHLIKGKITRGNSDHPIDVVVTDRHTAKIYAQTTAAVEKQLGGLFKGMLTLESLRAYKKGEGPLYKLKALLNPDGYNGSPILGLNAYALVGHGKASTNAIEAAIRRAIEYRRSNYVHLAHAALPEMQRIAAKLKPDTAARSCPE